MSALFSLSTLGRKKKRANDLNKKNIKRESIYRSSGKMGKQSESDRSVKWHTRSDPWMGILKISSWATHLSHWFLVTNVHILKASQILIWILIPSLPMDAFKQTWKTLIANVIKIISWQTKVVYFAANYFCQLLNDCQSLANECKFVCGRRPRICIHFATCCKVGTSFIKYFHLMS